MKPMQRIAITDLHTMFAPIINRAFYRGERFIITRRGEEHVALISIGDLRKLEEMEQERLKKNP